jgi:hypothetical protein
MVAIGANLALRAQRESEARLRSIGQWNELSAARASRLRAALDLHDGLSGTVLWARGTIRRRPEEACVVVARLTQAWARVCARVGMTAMADERLGEDVAEALGVPFRSRVTGSLFALDAAEWTQLSAIVGELVANSAVHAPGAMFELDVAVERRALSGGWRTSSVAREDGATSGSGRGLRNIVARVEARGGHVECTGGAGHFGWPRSRPSLRRVFAIWMVALIGVGAAFVVLRPSTRGLAFALATLTYLLVVGGTVVGRAARANARATRAWNDEVAAGTDAVVERINLEIEPCLALMRHDPHDVETVTAALAQLSLRLRRLLHDLEEEPGILASQDSPESGISCGEVYAQVSS